MDEQKLVLIGAAGCGMQASAVVEPAVLVWVWLAASVAAAGASPLAAGAPDDGTAPGGLLLFMDGHDTPTKLMLTK